jgi:hypothetical protein
MQRQSVQTCAAIISAFRTTNTSTHSAIGQAFHSNYAGSYLIPDAVLDVVSAKLTQLGALLANEPVRYRVQIRSLISSWG